MHHRLILAAFVFLSLAFEVVLYYYLFANSDFIIQQLSQVYREISPERLHTVFLVSNFIDMGINTFVYVMGFLSLFTHKVTYYNVFHGLLILAVFSRIIISYLNM